MSDSAKRAVCYKAILVSSLGNFVLFAIKLFAGLMSGSVAMVADAWHSLSDLLTSAIVLVGIKISHKPADEKHPFGHGRFDLIASVVVAIFLGIAGAGLIKMAIENLINAQTPQFSWFSVGVLVFAVLLKEVMARYSIYAGKKTGTHSLIADGWNHRSDVLATGVVLISTGLGGFFWWIDSLAGIVVAGFILWVAFKIFKKSGSAIIGEDIHPELYKKIEKIVCEVSNEVRDIHHFHTHCYGSHTEATFHIRLPKEKKLAEANAITTEIKQRLKKVMNIEATIYLDIVEE